MAELGALFVLAVIGLVWLFVLVGQMAEVRGQSATVWVILSLIWSPLACIVLLYLFFSVKEG